MSIAPIQPPSVGAIRGIEAEPRAARTEGPSSTFGAALQEASALEGQAMEAAQQFAAGNPGVGIHEVMIASEKANISLRFATTLKNKALDAYRELMQTQV